LEGASNRAPQHWLKQNLTFKHENDEIYFEFMKILGCVFEDPLKLEKLILVPIMIFSSPDPKVVKVR
jgi:hypothetical protein